MLVEVSQAGYSPADLKVIGLGGAGGNAVDRMLQTEIRGVEFLVANTDIQALNASACPNRLQIGASITGGLGSGGDPAIGRKSAEEDREVLREHLEGADMIFITAGMGGGTGTGASPVIAEVARDLGALTVGIVTRPFTFEGRKRMRQADDGVENLRGQVDTLIVIPNQRLLQVVDRSTPLNEALRVADDVLAHATKGISEIITVPGLINVDFADVRSVMRGMGNALMGMGFGQGEDRAKEAAQMAISSPLLEDVSIAGAKALLVNFMGGQDMTLAEVDEASNLILQAAGDDANVIFGSVVDPRMSDEIRVTLIATGFGEGTSLATGVAGAVSEAERILAQEIRGISGRTEPQPESPCPGSDASPEEPKPEPVPVGVGAEEGAGSPLKLHSRTGPQTMREPEAPSRKVVTAQAAEPLSSDGIVGVPRPISKPTPIPPAAPRPRVGPVTTGSAAAAGVEIPENVVPLVWKSNLRGREWKPTMSSRWQRVLRRDRLDVPSFLRRRQVD